MAPMCRWRSRPQHQQRTSEDCASASEMCPIADIGQRRRIAPLNQLRAAACLILIFSDDRLCRRRRPGRGRRDGEGDPGIPATGTILCGKLSVSLEIEIALHVADREKESDLGTDANHLGLEAADTVP